MHFTFILLSLFLLFLFIRPVTILIHELGHAIPAIIFTRKKVTVHIGSYGDTKNSLHLNAGLLEIWLRHNPFSWKRGICIYSNPGMSFNKMITIVLSGPLLSFLLAATASYFTFIYNGHGALKLVMAIFLGSAILDILVNLVPQEKPVTIYNGETVYNDGYQLKLLFYSKKLPAAYFEVYEQYQLKNYEQALQTAEESITQGVQHKEMYRMAIACAISMQEHKKALHYHKNMKMAYRLDSNDFTNLGIIYVYQNLPGTNLTAFEESIGMNPNNFYAYANRGYVLNLFGRFHEAITDFEKAILLNSDFPYPYNNRGLAKIKLGDMEGGLSDIRRSMEIDPDNAYAHRNLGIYYLDFGQKNEALIHLKRAKELDKYTHMADELIEQCAN
jgi:tetratricopeptide (TPR) repeat protein